MEEITAWLIGITKVCSVCKMIIVCLCVGEERTGIKLLLEKLHKLEFLSVYILYISVSVINK
jgi:hypothetical protein